MANGIRISKQEFKHLSAKEQNTILFENTEHIKGFLETIHQRQTSHELDDAYHRKITYWTMIGSSTLLAALFGITKYFNLL